MKWVDYHCFTFLLISVTCGLVLGTPHNYSTLHFKSTSSAAFRLRAKRTYDKVLPCVVGKSWMYENNSDTSRFIFPDDAEEHFEDLKRKTVTQRQTPVHGYAGYGGPWIENHFIDKYFNRPLHSFGGLIPIFVQWIDYQIQSDDRFDTFFNENITSWLRPNVLYLAISQGDIGLGKIGVRNPNILVLSAGGFGHVPLPLIRGEIKTVPPPAKYDQDIGFYGNGEQASRAEMFKIINATTRELGLKYKQGRGGSWKHDMEQTKFNLAPRGYGRSSFRFSESIQMGRLPVFLYSDVSWAPYAGSNITTETFGFVAGLGLTPQENTLVDLVHKIKGLSQSDFEHRLEVLKFVRPYYTYEGVLHQIDLFLKDPFGMHGGFLTCTKHPRTFRIGG